MADPAEPTSSTEPDSWGDYEPENTSKDLAIVNLANTGDKKAQNCCCARIPHVLLYDIFDRRFKAVDDNEV